MSIICLNKSDLTNTEKYSYQLPCLSKYVGNRSHKDAISYSSKSESALSLFTSIVENFQLLHFNENLFCHPFSKLLFEMHKFDCGLNSVTN